MSSQKGQSLIEVLIALAASVAVVTAIAITVITSLSNVEFTKNQNLASQYSREGMEVIRRMAKDNWTSFTATYTASSYCLDQNENLSVMLGSNCIQNVGCVNNICTFVRRININQNDTVYCSGNTRITSIVSWSDSKCTAGDPFCHNATLDSCLSNINTITPP